eukprot:gene6044-12183_t
MRRKLDDFKTVEDLLLCINSSKNVIVVTGAGVSVSCGIPDFRSKDGLYNTLDCDEYNIPSAELLFDLEYFQIDPLPFYKFAASLLPKKLCLPSPTHHFIAMLEKKNKLLRNYTQNVDGLERLAGISKLVECHGSMNFFRCMKCRKTKPLEELRSDVELGLVPYCACGGVLKPGITFFGESLGSSFMKQLKLDAKKCDLIIVIGTSLKVHSILEVLKHCDKLIPQVLINRDHVSLPAALSEGFDVELLGACDDVIRFICSRLRWEDALDSQIQIDQSQRLDVDVPSDGWKVTTVVTGRKVGRTLERLLKKPPMDCNSGNHFVCESVSDRIFTVDVAASSSSSETGLQLLQPPDGAICKSSSRYNTKTVRVIGNAAVDTGVHNFNLDSNDEKTVLVKRLKSESLCQAGSEHTTTVTAEIKTTVRSQRTCRETSIVKMRSFYSRVKP